MATMMMIPSGERKGRAVTASENDSAGTNAQVRAWLVTQILEFLPLDVRSRFLREAKPSLRAHFEGRTRDRKGWASYDDFVDALEIADRLAGRGDLALCFDIGRFTATNEAGPVRSFALRVFRPATVVTMATSLWSVHYRNAGRACARVTGPRAVTVSLVDVPRPHRAHCLAVGGWILGALELGPRSGIRVEQGACRCDGARTCEYRVSWRAD